VPRLLLPFAQPSGLDRFLNLGIKSVSSGYSQTQGGGAPTELKPFMYLKSMPFQMALLPLTVLTVLSTADLCVYTIHMCDNVCDKSSLTGKDLIIYLFSE
jgi:hypothetical protein